MRLANVIDERGIKQSWIADKMGVSQVSVSRWVNGYRQPSPVHLVNLLRLCGWDDDTLKNERLLDWYQVGETAVQ